MAATTSGSLQLSSIQDVEENNNAAPAKPVLRYDDLSIKRFDEAQIAVLAHQLWEERGCPDGSPDEDWCRAEELLNGQLCHDTLDKGPASF